MSISENQPTNIRKILAVRTTILRQHGSTVHSYMIKTQVLQEPIAFAFGCVDARNFLLGFSMRKQAKASVCTVTCLSTARLEMCGHPFECSHSSEARAKIMNIRNAVNSNQRAQPEKRTSTPTTGI
eukprot:6134717-Amphidinium_carterae.1